MPEIKDFITYIISILGIIVSGIFSFIVWKLSDATYKLSKSVASRQEYIEKLDKNNKLVIILNDINVAKEFMNNTLHREYEIMQLESICLEIKNKILASDLKTELIENLAELWNEIYKLLNKYYIIYRENEKYKTGFSGIEEKEISEAMKPIKEKLEYISEKLKNELEL